MKSLRRIDDSSAGNGLEALIDWKVAIELGNQPLGIVQWQIMASAGMHFQWALKSLGQIPTATPVRQPITTTGQHEGRHQRHLRWRLIAGGRVKLSNHIGPPHRALPLNRLPLLSNRGGNRPVAGKGQNRLFPPIAVGLRQHARYARPLSRA